MTCTELVELVTAYFDGTLPAEDRDVFEAHLAHCADCALYLAQMRMTLQLERKAEPLEERPEVAGLLAGFRDWRDVRL